MGDMNTNTRSYYQSQAEGLTPARRRIMKVIFESPYALSRHEISKIGRIPIQSVCGRVNELLEMGFLEVVGEKFDTATHREVEALSTPREIKSVKQLQKINAKSMIERLREVMRKTDGVAFNGRVYPWEKIFEGCK